MGEFNWLPTSQTIVQILVATLLGLYYKKLETIEAKVDDIRVINLRLDDAEDDIDNLREEMGRLKETINRCQIRIERIETRCQVKHEHI